MPNSVREFPAILRLETANMLMMESELHVARPVRVRGNIIANNGYLAIWFVFRNKWYDIGKFYDRKRRWIGYYCDIVNPVGKLLSIPSRTSVITDLFLDLWITPRQECYILDVGELQAALTRNHISRPMAQKARKQITNLIRLVRQGRFPPKAVRVAKPLAVSKRWP